MAEPYYEQEIFMERLVERAEAIHNKSPEKGDNMLLVTTDGRKAALDIGLVQDNPDPFRYGKIDDCAENVFRIYEVQTENRGVQLILSDIYQNNATGYNVYEDITQKLISKGIPRAEIGLAGAYKTTTQQTKLRVLANSGKLRVIIGSTITLGTGQNLQRRLCAIHNLDVPWNPKSLEQREGRIIRTGNLYPVVEIHNYVTERSFDAYTWQLVESKGKLISQLMHGKYIGRSIEEADVKVLSYAECKALATGDTSVLELAKLESEIARLEAVKHNQENAQSQLRYQVAHLLPRNIEQLEEVLPAIEEDAETLADWGEKRVLTLNGKDYDLRKQEDFEHAEEYFRTVTMKHLHNDAHIAFINGMEVTCWTKANYSLFPRHFACLHANCFYTQERPHTITGLKTFTNILEELIVEVQEIHEDRKTKLHAYRQALAAGQAHLDEDFDRQEELDDFIQRKESLQNILYTEAI